MVNGPLGRLSAAFAVYQHEVTGRELNDLLERDASRYTRSLAHAAFDLAPELDGLIERHARGWTVDRIAPLEKAIMRVAITLRTSGEKKRSVELSISSRRAVFTSCGSDVPCGPRR